MMDRNIIARIAALLVALTLFTLPGWAQTSNLAAEPTSSPGNSSSPSAAAGTVGSDYVIGPDDVLVVNVWKEPELSRSVLVRPDGKITLPLLKDTQASGSTPGQLQTRIEKSLSDYVSKPEVTVIVQEAKSHRFNILGEVQKPGSYLLNTSTTVLDAIALAGGFREWAKVNSIYILRETSSGKPTKVSFHYKDVVKGLAPNIQLTTKDTIIVP
jgi:polysaccharide export outer membrane protein